MVDLAKGARRRRALPRPLSGTLPEGVVLRIRRSGDVPLWGSDVTAGTRGLLQGSPHGPSKVEDPPWRVLGF